MSTAAFAEVSEDLNCSGCLKYERMADLDPIDFLGPGKSNLNYIGGSVRLRAEFS